ncbi:MAG: hypothetical protein ACRC4O_10880 [Giesbergeria sp.]
MTAPDPRAWRVAIALALALPEPPDWALWAAGRMRSSPGRAADTAIPPAPWDAAAYLADCARRGVEPGPLPSQHGRTASGLRWLAKVDEVLFELPDFRCWWTVDSDSILKQGHEITREQWVEIGTLATAAAKGGST